MNKPIQPGVALMMALLTVALVSVISLSFLSLQTQRIEVESARRQQQQAQWLLKGIIDWARLVLELDAQSSDIDKLDEPWGLELKDTQLSNFIAQQPGYAKTDLSTLTHLVFLSGHITDAQSKFNLTNLLTPQGDIVPSESKKLEKLFTSKGLSQGRSQNLVLNWQKSRGPPSKESPLLPVYHTKQLTWLGLSPAELTLLSPYLVILPEPTPLNVNTALAEVLYASLSNLAWPQALALTQPNRIRSWKNLGEVEKDLNLASGTLDGTQFSVKSNFFEINGALKYLQNTLGIGLLVQRLGNSQVIPIVRTRYTD